MYVGLKQPRGDGERYVTPARAAAKETNRNQTFSDPSLHTMRSLYQAANVLHSHICTSCASNFRCTEY